MVTDSALVLNKAQLIDAFLASGEHDKAAFARRHGLKPDTFRAWFPHRERVAASSYAKWTPAEKDLFVQLAHTLDDLSLPALLHAWRLLRDLPQDAPLPCASTIHTLLKAHGLTLKHAPLKRSKPAPVAPQEAPPKTFRVPEVPDDKPPLTEEELEAQRLALKQTRYQKRHRLPPQAELGQNYPSDVTDEQWALICPYLLEARGRKMARPRDKINAIFYILRTGAQWRQLPIHYPKWESVYSVFRDMKRDGRWKELNKALRLMDREASGREAESTAVLADTQSVKTTEKGGSAAMMATSA